MAALGLGLYLLTLLIGFLNATEPAILILTLLAASIALIASVRGRWQAAPLVFAALLLAVIVPAELGTVFTAIGYALSAAFAAVSAYLLYLFPVPHLPKPSGQHMVGLRIIAFENTRWSEHKRKTEASKRLQAYVWYPAEPLPEAMPRRYHSRAEARAFASPLKMLMHMGFLHDQFRLARTHSYGTASTKPGSYPLVIFNHGGASAVTQKFSLMEELASHGYVVFSLSHPGESAGVHWSDDSVTPIATETIDLLRGEGEASSKYAAYLLEQNRDRKREMARILTPLFEGSNSAMVHDWALDSMALVDALSDGSLASKNADLCAAIDLSRLAYIGMSIGGSVAHRCCHIDPRATAGINLDGTNWSFELVEQATPTPFLQCYADLSLSRAQLQKMSEVGEAGSELPLQMSMPNDLFYEGDAERGQRIDIIRLIWSHARHYAFTDVCLTVRGRARTFLDVGAINGREVSAETNQLCRLFLDTHLKSGEPAKLNSEIGSNSLFIRQKLN